MPRRIRVAVAGTRGKLGSAAQAALSHDPEIEFAGAFTRDASLDALLREKPDVWFDALTLPASYEVTMTAVAHGVRPVIATSGWSEEQRAALDGALRERDLGGLLVPNFSVGALLMMRFAEEAARYFPDAEIVEMHRATKKDKPSGTAAATATRIASANAGTSPQIHSVRLPGLLAHQEVIFGAAGETLTIRHDSLSYESFAPGIVRAVKLVGTLAGLHVGLPL